MNIFKSVILAGVILVAPSLASAQAIQNGGAAQPQTNGTQNTGTVQSDSNAPVQNNQTGQALNQYQPNSLGIVGSPSQTQPSVTVGPADIKAQNESIKKTRNYLPLTALVLAVILIAAGVASYRNPPVASQAEALESIPETIEEKPKKPKKKATGAAAKKKKKAHR